MAMYEKTLYVRFYEELNDFLPAGRKKKEFPVVFKGSTTIKDAVESVGVPHTEIDLILLNGISVDFDCIVEDGDRASIYPVFESLDISPIVRLRPKPLRECKFVLDVHLGKLARRLRLLGFDSYYRNDLEDREIVRISCEDKRAVLTRDVGIFKYSAVTHGYYLRSDKVEVQVKEVLSRFDLWKEIRSSSPRCTACNGVLEEVDKNSVKDELPHFTFIHYNNFNRCTSCGKLYWEGAHFGRLRKWVSELEKEAGR